MTELNQYQIMPALKDAEYAALKEDIRLRGVQVPVDLDEHGAVLDGHHRVRAWTELRSEGVDLPAYPTDAKVFPSEEAKLDFIRAINILRRHLTKEQIKEQWEAMRAEGRSYRQIAEATGVGKSTVARSIVPNGTVEPPVVVGKDKKQRKPHGSDKAKKPKSTQPPLAPQASFHADDEKQRQKAVAKAEKTAGLVPGSPLNVSDDPDYDGDEWHTPADYIALAREVLGEIDLDPASCTSAQDAVQAKHFLTIAEDGLVNPWFGRVWLNPPYSRAKIDAFIAKAIEEYDAGHATEILILVNNCTETTWFHSMLERFPACFPRGRLKFWHPDRPEFGARQGQVIFYLGSAEGGARFAFTFSKVGKVVVGWAI